VFLSHGFGAGLGLGMTYIPSISLISHHFQRRRTLALGIAASGSSLGGIIHPIMLNRLFHGSVGFPKGVRASAAFTFSLLIVSMILMRPRLPPAKTRSLLPKLQAFIRDPPYVSVVIASAHIIPLHRGSISDTLHRSSLILLGLYFPIFFLQLDAIKHGVHSNFAFFTVGLGTTPRRSVLDSL
jgi:MFS family permease